MYSGRGRIGIPSNVHGLQMPGGSDLHDDTDNGEYRRRDQTKFPTPFVGHNRGDKGAKEAPCL